MSYSEFLKKQSKEFLDEALGKENAKSFNKGDISITKFKERPNAPLSLAGLESTHNLSLINPED